MSDKANDLNTQLKASAESKVGGRAVTSRFGADCFALVDALLRSLSAKSAASFGKVTANADYIWGDSITLLSIKPGDIVQFRKHVIDVSTQILTGEKWFETEGQTQSRPHHTAIVIDVLKDGGVVVVEQNVRPDPNKVTRNVISRLAEGESIRKVNDRKRIKIKVTGQFWLYRPVSKPQEGATLSQPGQPIPVGRRKLLTNAVPAQGGSKRVPGPIGIS